MSTTMIRVGRLLAAAALAGLLAACGGSDDPAATAPTITTQPAALAVTEGQAASFSVVADGGAPLAYEWRRNGSAIAGAGAASYTLAAATLADNAASFSVVVSNSAGSVTSAAAVLTVNPLAVAPAITAQPAPLVLTAGGTATFTGTASGTPVPALRWFIEGGADLADGAGSGPLAGATIAGAGTTTLTLSAVPQAANGLQLRLRASNTAGTAETSAAALTVNAATVAPSITSQPAAVTITAGGNASFSVAVSGTPMPTVQWLIAGGANLADGAGTGALTGATIAGAGTATLTLSNVPATANGLLLAARAGNSAGAATSGSAALTVNLAGTAISAATGGTARAPGDAVLIEVPPGALTADATFTFTPVASIATFSEDFLPLPGTQWDLQVTGGQLIAGAALRLRMKVDPASFPASTQRARALARTGPASLPPGSQQQLVLVARCARGEPVTVYGDPDPDNYMNGTVLTCRVEDGELDGLGVVLRRPATPGTAVFDLDLASGLSGIYRLDQAELDSSGQVVLAYRVLEPDPARPGQTRERQRLARTASAGNVTANTLTPGAANPTVQFRQVSAGGSLAAVRRDGESGPQLIEVYGTVPFGSGRLLTGQRLATSLSFAAGTSAFVSGLAFVPAGGVQAIGYTGERGSNPWGLFGTTRTFLGRLNADRTVAWAREASGNFPGRPDTAGIFTRYTGASSVAVDASGSVYVVGGSDVNNSVTAFCSPLCPAIYKFSALGDPLWFRVLGPGTSFSPASVALDRLGQPVVRFTSATGEHLVTRMDAVSGAITGSAALGTSIPTRWLPSLSFDNGNRTYVGVGRFLFRVPADFSDAGIATIEFGQQITGEYFALGADQNGTAYGVYLKDDARPINPGSSTIPIIQLRLMKRTYP